jgi:hypothetical protein
MKRILFALAFVLVACGGEQPATQTSATATAEAKAQTPPPSVAQARELIVGSAELGDFEFTNASFTTPVDLANASAPVAQSARELEAAGWIAVKNGKVSLTPKSKSDKRFLLRENGILDIVPLAKKEVGDVTAVTMNPDGTASADFAWHWVPNEVALSFKTGALHDRFATPRTSKATMIWDGTTWSVLRIE